jgi:hypothetical protein
VYPGNVLILDRAPMPCQDMPEMRVASPRATSACPGTFPRCIAPSSRPKRRDLSFFNARSQDEQEPPIEPSGHPRPTRPATRAGTGIRLYPSIRTGRGASPWAPLQPGDPLITSTEASPPCHPDKGRTSSPQRVSPANVASKMDQTSLQGVFAHGFNLGFSRSRPTPGGIP